MMPYVVYVLISRWRMASCIYRLVGLGQHRLTFNFLMFVV
jgi:hypothetical protein